MNVNEAEEILRLQNELNEGTAGKNWKSGMTDKGRKIDYKLCVAMEASELIDSLNWKHWKDINAPVDIENAKVETVDILHFMASWALENELEYLFVTVMTTDWVAPNLTAIEVGKQLIAASSSHHPYFSDALRCLKDLINIFDFEDEIYSIYLGKNVLNKFRQNNGYKDGSYIKVWDGQEDNVFMVETLNGESYTADELYGILERKYEQVLGDQNAIS